MLTIHKVVASGAVGYAKYLSEVEAHGDYYVGADGDPWASPGEWIGSLAAELGLDGEVSRAALLAVMEGRDPRTDERVVRAGSTGDHVAAHDLVFSAPSSVTVAWVMADEEGRGAIQEAHDEAVRDAFAHIEKYFPLVRRRHGEQLAAGIAAFERTHGRPPTQSERWKLAPILNETAESLLSAHFAHHTARQTEGQASAGLPPDPQLHSHVLLLGLAKRRDGRLVAVDSLVLHRGRGEAGAVYRAALAGRLSALGFEIERRTGQSGQYFELRGISARLREEWSSRHKEVESKGDEWRRSFRESFGRLPTQSEERDWAAKTRAAKAKWHGGNLFQRWHAQAAALGATQQAAAEAADRRRTNGNTLPPATVGCARLVEELLSPEGVTREHATFDLARLRFEAYRRAPGLVVASDVERALSELTRHHDVIEVEPGVWTTREMLALERRVLAWRSTRMEDRPAAGVFPVNGASWERALARCQFTLSPEQLTAVEALRDSAGFTALVGEAGVGKGVVLRVAADAWRADGRRVLAVAVGGAQAQRLAADLGEGTQALTLDALIYRIRVGALRLGSRDVVAIDEAGQVDTRRWAAFADVLAGVTGPKVVALGDDAQLSSITAGGMWPQLAAGAARLTEVRRTKLEWERQAWAHLRRGESTEALALYARHGRLTVAGTRAEALDQAVSRWNDDGRTGLIVTDASNAERYRANIVAQAFRLACHELGGEAIEVATPSGLVELHAGDRVIFKGQYRPPAMRRVENGTTAEVVAVDLTGGRRILVRTHEATPRELAVSLDDYVGLDLNYAAHVSTAQGTTVPTAYVVAGGWQTNRESLYVQVSRSQRGSRLFVDRESLAGDGDAGALDELVRRAAQSRAKVAAASGELPRGYRSYLEQTEDIPAQVGRGVAAAATAAEQRSSKRKRAEGVKTLVAREPRWDWIGHFSSRHQDHGPRPDQPIGAVVLAQLGDSDGHGL